MLLTPAQIKPKSFESKRNCSSSVFLPGVDAPHVYMRAWALGCFRSLISTRTFSEGADRVAGQLRGDKEVPFSGETTSGRVWRKVPKRDARNVSFMQSVLVVCLWYCLPTVLPPITPPSPPPPPPQLTTD